MPAMPPVVSLMHLRALQRLPAEQSVSLLQPQVSGHVAEGTAYSGPHGNCCVQIGVESCAVRQRFSTQVARITKLSHEVVFTHALVLASDAQSSSVPQQCVLGSESAQQKPLLQVFWHCGEVVHVEPSLSFGWHWPVPPVLISQYAPAAH
jgi:hypothetical protein